jgi:hypothetical protein
VYVLVISWFLGSELHNEAVTFPDKASCEANIQVQLAYRQGVIVTTSGATAAGTVVGICLSPLVWKKPTTQSKALP